MRIAMMAAAIGLVIGSAQSPHKPLLAPFFSNADADHGPAFFITCRNDTGAEVSSGAREWTSNLRLDGRILEEEGGRIGPGLTVPVAAGEIWRGILVLRQSNTGYFPAVKFGAMVRQSRMVALTEGRHTLAVQCRDVWSDDVEFFWEKENPPSSRVEP